MPDFLSSRKIVKILERKGFVGDSRHGSHYKLKKIIDGVERHVVVPMKNKELPYGTFKSILRQSNLKKRDFL